MTKAFLVAAVCLLWMSSAAIGSARQTSPAESKIITVAGTVNSCYKPNKWVVFVTSVPRGTFESETVVLGPNGRFTLRLDPANAKPGKYVFNFGKTKRGAGGKVFTITPDSTAINLGTVGDCDI
jgi:hypothetical protein